MDLSWLKWPAIVVGVIVLFWALSSPGVNFMFNKFTAAEVGADPKVDARDEAGLTRLGNYLMKTLRYGRAEEVIQTAVDRYGTDGKNYWLNMYRLVRLAEKRGDYEHAVELLDYLIVEDAPGWSLHIPPIEILVARRDKLVEVHELDKKRR